MESYCETHKIFVISSFLLISSISPVLVFRDRHDSEFARCAQSPRIFPDDRQPTHHGVFWVKSKWNDRLYILFPSKRDYTHAQPGYEVLLWTFCAHVAWMIDFLICLPNEEELQDSQVTHRNDQASWSSEREQSDGVLMDLLTQHRSKRRPMWCCLHSVVQKIKLISHTSAVLRISFIILSPYFYPKPRDQLRLLPLGRTYLRQVPATNLKAAPVDISGSVLVRKVKYHQRVTNKRTQRMMT